MIVAGSMTGAGGSKGDGPSGVSTPARTPVALDMAPGLDRQRAARQGRCALYMRPVLPSSDKAQTPATSMKYLLNYLTVVLLLPLPELRAMDGANAPPVVSQSDLIYDRPAATPGAGQPLGNGRMGTLVWTSPTCVHLQINRNDVFAVNRNHGGAQFGATDYCGGCAGVLVDVGGRAFDPERKGFRQRLSLLEAECSLGGQDVQVRCFVSAAADVLVLEIDDQRPTPQPLRLTVAMLREPEVKTGQHVARSAFTETTDQILLTQRFQEQAHYHASAVVVALAGGGAQVETPTAKERVLVVPAHRGRRTLLISSAAAADPQTDVGAAATALVRTASTQPAESLRRDHRSWWSAFWARTFVQLTSADGRAEQAVRARNLHLYYLASSSRGALPPKWNAGLFATAGDKRQWGSQFWVWTTEMLYLPLLAADALDLTDPYFNMYVRQLPNCEIAARQRWGVAGAFFPETTAYDGPTTLPDDVAAEFQDVLLGRKKPTELSPRAFSRCRFDSQLNAATEPQKGRYSWISHVTSSGSELAIQAWWRYRCTGDRQWLRTHAYPLLRGTVEFYRHLVKPGADGRYHLSGTNVHEDFWGVRDSLMDLAAIRGTAPLAIRAAEILGRDAELRGQWKELLDKLAPYPKGAEPQAQALTGGVLADDVWAAGYLGDVNGQNNPEDVWLTPVFPFEDWTLETGDAALGALVQKTLTLAPRHASVLRGATLSTAIRTPIVVVRAGRGQELPAVLERYTAAFAPLPNGMSLFEGPTAPSVEHLGLLTTTLQEALLQSVSARPGEPEVLRVFPAWPLEWDGSFRLLARGGFLVTSEIRKGHVEYIEIQSRLGEECRLRNPWDGACLVSEVGGPDRTHDGRLLRFQTAAGKCYRLTQAARR